MGGASPLSPISSPFRGASNAWPAGGHHHRAWSPGASGTDSGMQVEMELENPRVHSGSTDGTDLGPVGGLAAAKEVHSSLSACRRTQTGLQLVPPQAGRTGLVTSDTAPPWLRWHLGDPTDVVRTVVKGPVDGRRLDKWQNAHNRAIAIIPVYRAPSMCHGPSACWLCSPQRPCELSIAEMEPRSPFAQPLERWLDPVPLKCMSAPFPGRTWKWPVYSHTRASQQWNLSTY